MLQAHIFMFNPFNWVKIPVLTSTLCKWVVRQGQDKKLSWKPAETLSKPPSTSNQRREDVARFAQIFAGSTISTLLHGKINPKKMTVVAFVPWWCFGFLQFLLRVVSSDYGKPWFVIQISKICDLSHFSHMLNFEKDILLDIQWGDWQCVIVFLQGTITTYPFLEAPFESSGSLSGCPVKNCLVGYVWTPAG